MVRSRQEFSVWGTSLISLVPHFALWYNIAAFPPTCREAGDIVTPERKAGQPFPLWKRVIYEYGQAVEQGWWKITYGNSPSVRNPGDCH